jgi:hypothetical protein
MIGSGHTDFRTKFYRRRFNARIVGGNYHSLGGTLTSLFPDSLNHRLAGNIPQGLAWQTHGAETGWNNHCKLHRTSSLNT